MYCVGALIIGIGFWDILYYNYNREPPKTYSNYAGLYITFIRSLTRKAELLNASTSSNSFEHVKIQSIQTGLHQNPV